MNVLSLCSGAGGLELGAKQVIPEARVVCYVEREAFAAAHLVSKMQTAELDTAPVWSDLQTFEGKAWRGCVDLVTAGFPCQPFSAAGKKLGAEDERNAWPDVARIICDVRPGLVFLENVPTLTAGYLGVVLGDLAALGFNAEWGLFSAAEVGAPHLRRRLFIVAAHPESQRRREGRSEFTGRIGESTPDGRSDQASNTNGGRQQGKRRGGLLDEEWEARRDDANGCRGSLSYSDGAGLSSRGARGCEEEYAATSSHWRHVTMPEPAIRRVDDGVANRVDRLRLCGNGVVPQQAAAAFRELWSRMKCR